MKLLNIIFTSLLSIFRKEDILYYHKPIQDSVYESNGVRINYSKYADVIKQKQKNFDVETKQTENVVLLSNRINSNQIKEIKELLLEKKDDPLFLVGSESILKILNIKI